MLESTTSASTQSATASISPRLTAVKFTLLKEVVFLPISRTFDYDGPYYGTRMLDLSNLEESAKKASLKWLRSQYPVSGFDEKDLKCVTAYNGDNQRRIRLTVGAGPEHWISDGYGTRCTEHTALYVATTDWLPREDCDVPPGPGDSNAASRCAIPSTATAPTTVLYDPGPSAMTEPELSNEISATHLDNDATTAHGVTVNGEASAGHSNTATSVASVSQGEGGGSSRGDRYKKRFNRLFQMTRMKRGKAGSSVGTEDEGP